jgi:FkbM family methyltransferase
MHGIGNTNKTSIFKYKTNGTIFNLRKNTFHSGVIIESWWLKSYTRHLKNVPDNAVIIDIGTHIGAFSLFAAAKYPQSRIFSFEPSNDNFALLKKNIVDNNLTKRIKAFKSAVTDGKSKTVTLNLHPSNSGMHSTVFDYDLGKKGKKNKVPATSLEKIFTQNKITSCDILKLDCEGAEYNILFSTPKDILKKIKNIVMEYDDKGEINKLKKLLENTGFKIMFYDTIPITIPRTIKRLQTFRTGKAPMLLAS